jgi:hypothetical protein
VAIYSTASVDQDHIKVRWQEPYVSEALNKKLFGFLPKGIYAGFSIGPGGLGDRDIGVGHAYVSGGFGSGVSGGGFVSGSFDETVGFGLAIHSDINGYSSAIVMPAGTAMHHLDATGRDGTRVYMAIDAVYTVGSPTTATVILVDAAQLNADPSLIVIGFCDVPVVTPLNSGHFGYNDPTYPRISALSTAVRAGFMPKEVWGLLSGLRTDLNAEIALSAGAISTEATTRGTADNKLKKQILAWAISGVVVSGDQSPWLRVPFAHTLTGAYAIARTAGSTATSMDIFYSAQTSVSGVTPTWTTVLSTKLTMDLSERSTYSAAVQPVLTNTGRSANDHYKLEVTNPGTGLSDLTVMLEFTMDI